MKSHHVLDDQMLLDSLLELKFLLIERSNPEAVVAAFLGIRRRLEKCEFLLAYRLRQWLENQISVQVTSDGRALMTQPLRLHGYCLRHAIQHYQREIFENKLEVNSLGEIKVSMAWNIPVVAMENTEALQAAL
ncbi:MAG: hypothetical protein AAGA58_13280 [Verrucomicrobiota bacterium]